MRRFELHSLRNRLGLVFFGITLAALVFIYMAVVPSLGGDLQSEALRSLASAVDSNYLQVAETVGTSANHRDEASAVRQVERTTGARVTLLSVSSGPRSVQTSFIADSTGAQPTDLQFPLAVDAVRMRQTVTGTEAGAAGRVGEAAKPLFYRGHVARVLVLSEPLNEVSHSVDDIRDRILIAGAIALTLALTAGYVVARALSLRVKRLEQTARRVAAGDFSASFALGSRDELGQLAEALDDMQRQLAQLDSARERFIATASHELRTPIFSLGGFLELIEDEDLDEDTRAHFLRELRTQVERLGKLTTGLLDLSRLESGALELDPRPSDVSALARSVTAEFQPALAQHDSHLQLRLRDEPLGLVCDPDRVAQILRILIDNAIAHTPVGTDIVVSAMRENGSVRLAVRDYGLGIKRAVLSRIFEPFYTSDGVQGSGLGLAIAHELAERMRGHLQVESVPGRTVFTLELPAR